MTAAVQLEPVERARTAGRDGPDGERTDGKSPRSRHDNPGELARAVCARVARGQLLKDACARVGVARRTFRQWLEDDPDGLAKVYERARIEQAHAMAEEAVRIAGRKVGSMEDVQRLRLMVDTRKWYVSKVAPALYGERVEHSHKHTHGVVMLPPVAAQAMQAGSASAGSDRNLVPHRSPDHARAFRGIASAPPEVLALPDATGDTVSPAEMATSDDETAS